MKSLKFLILFSSFLFFNSNYNFVYARDLAGLEFKEKQENLILNGLGIRKATIFKVKVYVAGLYLESNSSSSSEILNSNQDKKIVMKFLRDVSSKKIKNAYVQGFESNNENLNSISEKIALFTKSVVGIKENDIMTIDFVSNKVITKVNNKIISEISGKDFSDALLKIWLGKKPPNKSLKEGMLGSS